MIEKLFEELEKLLDGASYYYGCNPLGVEELEVVIKKIKKEVMTKPEGVPCKRCGEKPEVIIHCTLYKVRCANRKCPKCSSVGSHDSMEKALDAWKKLLMHGKENSVHMKIVCLNLLNI